MNVAHPSIHKNLLAGIAFALLTVPASANNHAPQQPQSQPADSQKVTQTRLVKGDFHALLQNKQLAETTDLANIKVLVSDGSAVIDGTLRMLDAQYALVEYAGPAQFQARKLFLLSGGIGVQADIPSRRTSRIPFFDDRLIELCSAQTPESCLTTTGLEAEAMPHVPGNTVKVISIRPDFAVVELETPEDFELEAVILTNPATGNKNSLLLRMRPEASRAPGFVNVTFTPVDPSTVSRTFSRRIARQYLVVDLIVKNPGPKKVQFKKSAVWFEVDYVEAEVNKEGDVNALPPANPSALRKDGTARRTYRYGLEHSQEHAPTEFLTVLGVFDDRSAKTQRVFDLVKVGVGVFAALGGTIFTGSDYNKAMSILGNTLLPGFRDIFVNEEVTNRLRRQLIDQSFPNIIQVASKSSEQTKLFLPRHILLGKAARPVFILQVRDVHLDLEVVSEVILDLKAKGQVDIGMTEEQVIQALGLPDTIDPLATGRQLKFARGPVATVDLNADRQVIGQTKRDLKTQLELEVGKKSETEVMAALNVGQVTKRKLLDGSVVWIKPGNLEINLRFGKNGALAAVGYATASERLAKLEGSTREDFEAALEKELKDLAADSKATQEVASAIAKGKKAAGPKVTYPSPDMVDEEIQVTYKDDEGVIATIKVFQR